MTWIIICIMSFLFIYNVPSADCMQWSAETVLVKDWKFEDYSPQAPINLKSKLNDSNQNEPFIRLEFELKNLNSNESATIMLLANPFAKNQNQCVPLNISDSNLRQYQYTFTIDNKEKEPFLIYEYIFPGCYYFIATVNGTHWTYPPEFYNTSYTYYNTGVTVADNHYIGEDVDKFPSMHIILKIPLECIKLRIELRQKRRSPFMNETKDLGSFPVQMCHLKNISETVETTCTVCMEGSNVNAKVLNSHREHGDPDGQWIVYMKWENLTQGGAYYKMDFSNDDLDDCKTKFGAENIETWRLIIPHFHLDFDYNNSTYTPEAITENYPWQSIVYGTVGGIVCLIFLIVLSYWIVKYRRLRTSIDRAVESGPIERPTPLLRGKESNKILLIYEQGSNDFMREIENLKRSLEQRCSGCEVHDVYAQKEWSRVNEIGASGWVQEQFQAGSKIVWVDTPELRARFNDKANQFDVADSRDDAILYAITVVRDSFVDSTTQYQRHFVVRMKRFEVEDRGDDDPLQVVTPYARYYIPDQFHLLCKDLKGAMKLLENNHGNFYTKIDHSPMISHKLA